MSNTPTLVSELNFVEAKMYETVTALTEALVRQAAAQHRGPLTTPNADWWETYIQDLRNELIGYNKSLEVYLSAINWQGASLPSSPSLWPEWWTAVRKYASSVSPHLPYLPEVGRAG